MFNFECLREGITVQYNNYFICLEYICQSVKNTTKLNTVKIPFTRIADAKRLLI